MFNTLKYRKFWFTISGLIILFGVISLSLYGLKLGIDFKGGTISELQFENKYDIAKIKETLNAQDLKNYQLQATENNGLIIKTESLEKDKHDILLEALKKQVGNFQETKFDSIGPVVGKELKRSAIYQLLIVSLGIVAYIAYAFRKVPKPIT
ncbi:MAG: protein translocase subunit SecF, partial [Candidatus Doudnabacteria bacterium]|nr:protein translocase subunit SecF [Candidatus Doudnabacteria bacterium]